jgi:chromosome partitioning protein
MATIYAFAGQKGGTGKTTLATATAAELAGQGHRVLLVDADPQGSSRTWAAVANEAGHPVPSTVAMDANMHRPGQLDAVAASFDVVVVDCPPRHGDTMRAALMVADVAVLPCGPSAVDAWALAESLDLVSQARGWRPELKACVVLTRKVARTAIGNSAREVMEGCGLPVLDTETHYRVAYQEALAVGLGVAQYAPGTLAAAEVAALVNELEEFNKTRGMDNGQNRAPNAA